MKAFLHQPQSVFVRRALFQVHLWTGVLAGLYVIVVCGTGAALVFRIDMQRAAHPHLFTPSRDGPQADPVTIMESVKSAYPEGRLSGVDAPTTARPTYLAYVMVGQRFLTILVDPVSAKVSGELPDRSIVRWVQDLHYDLLGGRTGRVVNGIGGLCLVVMCMTGLVLWWPGVSNWRRGFTVDFARSWKRINWDLHGAVGIWALVFIAMWAVTGVYFAFPSQFRATIDWISPLSVARTPTSNPAGAGTASPPTWTTLVAKARERVPDEFVARVVVPSTDTAAFIVLFSKLRPTPVGDPDLTSVYLDQFTGEPLNEGPRARRTIGDVVMAWVAPLHVGSFGGFGVKLVWLVLGLAPALLAVTGIIMWWTRVVRARWIRPHTLKRTASLNLSSAPRQS